MYANAKWFGDTSIQVEINGKAAIVPADMSNTDYQRISKLVDAGDLVVAPADLPAPMAATAATPQQMQSLLLTLGLTEEQADKFLIAAAAL
jgi:hypothetical protein